MPIAIGIQTNTYIGNGAVGVHERSELRNLQQIERRLSSAYIGELAFVLDFYFLLVKQKKIKKIEGTLIKLMLLST